MKLTPRRVAAALAAPLVVLALTLSATPAQAATTPLPPVPSVDLQRYAGQWNELASIPQIYTAQCRKDTTAQYTVLDASTVGVKNTCTSFFGIRSTVDGTAKALDPTNASLRVTFQGIPSFGSSSTPNYVVTALAPDYSWAIVGDPDRRSGFVLSRSTSFTDAQWKQVRAIVEARGYDSCRFVTTKTTGGRSDRTPLCRL
ncbi:MAG: lipocalin family protein [Aeromicrobium erythreum]